MNQSLKKCYDLLTEEAEFYDEIGISNYVINQTDRKRNKK